MAKKYAIIGTILLQTMMIVASQKVDIKQPSNSLSKSKENLKRSQECKKQEVSISPRTYYSGPCGNRKSADSRWEMIPVTDLYGNEYP